MSFCKSSEFNWRCMCSGIICMALVLLSICLLPPLKLPQSHRSSFLPLQMPHPVSADQSHASMQPGMHASPTPTANQLSHCITAAPHPPSPHASPRPHSSQAKTVTHMPTWPSTLPLMDSQVARDLQTCPSLLWMWVYTPMVVYFMLLSFLLLTLLAQSCYHHAFLMVQSSERFR